MRPTLNLRPTDLGETLMHSKIGYASILNSVTVGAESSSCKHP